MSYERHDASLHVIGASFVLLAAALVSAIFISAGFFLLRYQRAGARPTSGRQTSFTGGPWQQPGILRSYHQMETSASAHLDGYGWVDRQAGIARIPIDRAMALLLSGATPAPPPATPAPGRSAATPAPSPKKP